MDQVSLTLLNPNAVAFIPSHVQTSNLNPCAEVYIPTYITKWNTDAAKFRKEFNPEAESFVPSRRLNPNAKEFIPTTTSGVEKQVNVKSGEMETTNGKRDHLTTTIPFQSSATKMTKEDLESCDSQYWQFWRPRFAEYKKLQVEGYEYFKFYL